MPELNETETIVTANKADLKQGYFSVYTTEKHVADWIRKRLAPSEILDIKTTSEGDRVDSWDFKLAAQCFTGWPGIKSIARKKAPSEKQLAARVRAKERLKEMRGKANNR